MIRLDYDMQKMQYTIVIDREEIKNGALNCENYNNLISRISKLIFEEMGRLL